MPRSPQFLEAQRRIEELLGSDEMVELMKPIAADLEDSANRGRFSEEDIPAGPWIVSGWVIAVDMTSFTGTEDGLPNEEPETWSMCMKRRVITDTQAGGLGQRIANRYL